MKEREKHLEIRQRGTKARLSLLLLEYSTKHRQSSNMPSKAQREAEGPFDGLSKWIDNKHTGYKCRLISKEIPGNLIKAFRGWS